MLSSQAPLGRWDAGTLGVPGVFLTSHAGAPWAKVLSSCTLHPILPPSLWCSGVAEWAEWTVGGGIGGNLGRDRRPAQAFSPPEIE